MDEEIINLGFHATYTLPFCPLVSFLPLAAWVGLGWFGVFASIAGWVYWFLPSFELIVVV